MAVKVSTMAYKSLSPAVFICCQYMYAFIRRANTVKATLPVTDVGARASMVTATNLSSSPCMRSHITFSFSSVFRADGSSVELSACNFTPKGEKKKPHMTFPTPLSMKQSATFKCQFVIEYAVFLCVVRRLGFGLNQK